MFVVLLEFNDSYFAISSRKGQLFCELTEFGFSHLSNLGVFFFRSRSITIAYWSPCLPYPVLPKEQEVGCYGGVADHLCLCDKLDPTRILIDPCHKKKLFL